MAAAERSHWRMVCPPIVPWSRDPHVYYAGGILSHDLRPGYSIGGTNPTDGPLSPYNGH